MNCFIALYRGINVGGRNPVKMAKLCAMHERLGYGGVTSYIQSGNIVFSANGAIQNIARKIAGQFVEEFGFAAQVMVMPAARWGPLVRGNPFAIVAAKDPRTVHVGVCDGKPSVKGLKALQEKTGGSESFAVAGGIIYLHAPDGVGTSKFAAGMEKACGVPITMRNWRTIEAIGKMIDV